MEFIEKQLKQAIEWHSTGNLQKAGDMYMKILAADPENGDANNLLGVLYHQAGNSEKAVGLISKAIENFPDRFSYYLNLGVIYGDQRKLHEAKEAYQKALSLSPGNPDIFFNLGNTYKELGEVEKAINSFKEAIKLNPGHASACFNLGNSYLQLARDTEAIEAFEQTVKIDTGFADAWINLGDCYEKANKLDDAKRCLNHLMELDNENIAANTLKAKILRRDGEFNLALEVLLGIKIPADDQETAARIHYEFGRIYDRVGNADEAFKHFSKANHIQLQTERVQKSSIDKTKFLNFAEETRQTYAHKGAWPLQEGMSRKVEGYPVFLVGFPRSGTTLTGQIVSSHPEVQVMVEKPVLDTIVKNLLTVSKNYHSAVTTMSLEKIKETQANYFHIADRYISRDASHTLIDQQPLNIVHIDLVQKIFPNAKIILVVRHPYDVCLSCLMQHFELNDAMANFTTLEDSAILYDQVMALWQQYAKLLRPNFHVVKYENLVENFEHEIRQLLDFMEIEWNPTVLAHHKHSRNHHERINTASYHQVIEPVYTRSRYRWKSYRKYFNEIAPLLDPYVKFFGYSNL